MDFKYLETFILNLNDFAIFEKTNETLKYFSDNDVEAPVPYIFRKYLFLELDEMYDSTTTKDIKLKFLKISKEGFALIGALLILRVYLTTTSNLHHKAFKKHLPATLDLLLDYLNQKISNKTLRYNLNFLATELGLSPKFTQTLIKFFFRNHFLIMKNLFKNNFPLKDEIFY
ncbi:MAG: hypothetical protein ACRCWM_00840 [Sarcina sp.]